MKNYRQAGLGNTVEIGLGRAQLFGEASDLMTVSNNDLLSLARMRGADAINADEFITKTQFDSTLKMKAGTVAGASFTSISSEQVYDVVFSTALADANYSISLLSSAKRAWYYSAKTATGFRIQSQSNDTMIGDTIDWHVIVNGES